jgi:hypothetical protein
MLHPPELCAVAETLIDFSLARKSPRFFLPRSLEPYLRLSVVLAELQARDLTLMIKAFAAVITA